MRLTAKRGRVLSSTSNWANERRFFARRTVKIETCCTY